MTENWLQRTFGSEERGFSQLRGIINWQCRDNETEELFSEVLAKLHKVESNKPGFFGDEKHVLSYAAATVKTTKIDRHRKRKTEAKHIVFHGELPTAEAPPGDRVIDLNRNEKELADCDEIRIWLKGADTRWSEALTLKCKEVPLKEIVQRLREMGIDVSLSTLKRDLRDARELLKLRLSSPQAIIGSDDNNA